MSVAFWSVKLTNGKAAEVQPPEGYVLNVQQAAMTGEGHAVVKVNTVSVEGDKISSVICTLRSKTNEQCGMNLVFGYDVPVAFSSEGKGEVYLSGYYQPGPEEDDENDYDEYGEDEEDSEDEEDDEDDDDDEEAKIMSAEAAIAKLGAGRKNDLVVSGKKVSKAQLQSDSEDDDEEDDEEDSEEDGDSEGDEEFIKKMIKRNGLQQSSRVEELDAEDSEEEEDDEDDDEEDSEEEAPPVKVQKVQSKGTVVNQKSNTPAQKGNNSKPNTPAQKPQQQAQKTPQGGKPNGNNNNNKTPNTGNKHQNSGFKSGDKRKR